MDKFFSIFGKIVLGFVLIGIFVGGGYYFGKYYNNGQKSSLNSLPSPTSQMVQATQAPDQTTESPSASPTQETGRKVTSGSKTAFFSPYTATVPPGWLDSQDTNTSANTLTLTKGTNKIVISQSPGGGGGCVYPGETPQQMTQVFTSYVGIMAGSSELRRGPNGTANTYTVCEKKAQSFGFPTFFGYITITADAATLPEVDSILASLTIQ